MTLDLDTYVRLPITVEQPELEALLSEVLEAARGLDGSRADRELVADILLEISARQAYNQAPFARPPPRQGPRDHSATGWGSGRQRRPF